MTYLGAPAGPCRVEPDAAVSAAVKALPADSRLREMAEQLIERGTRPQEPGLLCPTLQGQELADRHGILVAAWLAGYCDGDGVHRNELISRLSDLMNGRVQPRGCLANLASLSVPCILAALMVWSHTPWIASLSEWLLLALLGTWGLRRQGLAGSGHKAAAAISLGRLCATGKLDELVQGMSFAYPRTRRASRQGLLLLLGQLARQPYGMVGAWENQIIVRLLRRADGEIVAAALQALRAVGQPVIMREVERLRQRSRSPELRARADEVVQVLEARRVALQQSSTLVRAATGPDAEELVRPAAAAESVEEQLLRPSRPPDGV